VVGRGRGRGCRGGLDVAAALADVDGLAGVVEPHVTTCVPSLPSAQYVYAEPERSAGWPTAARKPSRFRPRAAWTSLSCRDEPSWTHVPPP
jgi:hypothetical protein